MVRRFPAPRLVLFRSGALLKACPMNIPPVQADSVRSPASRLTRRTFLQQTLIAAAGTIAVPHLLSSTARGAGPTVAPADRIRIGLIGKGSMGSGHLRFLSFRDDVELLAVCDVDRRRAEQGAANVNETLSDKEPLGTYLPCKSYTDYREVLARPDIDAVVIVTPDHWHALITIEAAKAGKDIYCEKPVSLTIEEGRRLVETVRRYGRVFQTGTQYRSIPEIRKVCQFVRDGHLGKTKAVYTHYWDLQRLFSEPRFAPYTHVIDPKRCGASFPPLDYALPAEPVPEGLDWDLWVGPAPWRGFNSLYHTDAERVGVPWVFDEAFGESASTQYFSHAADVLQWAIGHETSGPVEIIHPSSGQYPTLTCRYADGTLLHLVHEWDEVKTAYKAVPAHARLTGLFGAVFVGEKGWLTSMTTGSELEGEPESLFEQMGFKRRPRANAGNNTHHANWLECIRNRQAPSAHEEIGHRSASLAHLINISYVLGQSLRWDPVKEVFAGPDAANRLRSRALRSPWRF